ncbi:hypothetical protein HY490_02490 [Candidatus Woesearchaeota archaeon]|nr:hypothetical protein [Candidatus Woesearchaeota archaeon]
MKKTAWVLLLLALALPVLAQELGTVGETLKDILEKAAANPLTTARIFIVVLVTLVLYEVLSHLHVSTLTSIIIGVLFGIMIVAFLPAPVATLIGSLWATLLAILFLLLPLGALYLLYSAFPALKWPLLIIALVLLITIQYSLGEVQRTARIPILNNAINWISSLGWIAIIVIVGMGILGLGGAVGAKKLGLVGKREMEEITLEEKPIAETDQELAKISSDVVKSSKNTREVEQGTDQMETELADADHAATDAIDQKKQTGRVTLPTQTELAKHQQKIIELNKWLGNVKTTYAQQLTPLPDQWARLARSYYEEHQSLLRLKGRLDKDQKDLDASKKTTEISAVWPQAEQSLKQIVTPTSNLLTNIAQHYKRLQDQQTKIKDLSQKALQFQELVSQTEPFLTKLPVLYGDLTDPSKTIVDTNAEIVALRPTIAAKMREIRKIVHGLNASLPEIQTVVQQEQEFLAEVKKNYGFIKQQIPTLNDHLKKIEQARQELDKRREAKASTFGQITEISTRLSSLTDQIGKFAGKIIFLKSAADTKNADALTQISIPDLKKQAEVMGSILDDLTNELTSIESSATDETVKKVAGEVLIVVKAKRTQMSTWQRTLASIATPWVHKQTDVVAKGLSAIDQGLLTQAQQNLGDAATKLLQLTTQ